MVWTVFLNENPKGLNVQVQQFLDYTWNLIISVQINQES